MNWSLADIRRGFARSLLVLAALHVPLTATAVWSSGQSAAWPAGLAAALAAIGMAVYLRCGIAEITRLVIAVVLIAQVSVLVYAFAGHPWQPDIHMYYFAVLALLAGFCDWRPIVVGAGLTAAHHLVLQYVLPSAVFYQGGSLLRVLLHAVIVVVETTFLAMFATTLARMFAAHEQSLNLARQATERERELRERETLVGQKLEARATALQESVRSFRSQMEETLSVLDRSTQAMQGGSQAFAGTTDEVRQQSRLVSSTADSTLTGLDRLGAASTELATSIAEIGRNGTDSAERSKRAADLARRARGELDQLVTSSDDAGTVVETIRGIAAQTSMLALNATIEAARAGEMGRGFAVVANEVKTLAAQTAHATDEVSRQIAAMQRVSERSVRAIRDIVAALGAVEQGAEAIAFAVQTQGLASAEIAEQLQLLSENARRSTGVVVSFDEMTVRTQGAAGQLRTAADALAGQARSLRGEVESFCQRVAAA